MEQERIDRFEELMESDQRDPEVQYQLGLCYLRGDGTDRDGQLAQTWLRRAADQGHPEAAALLAQAQPQEEQLCPITEVNLLDW